MAHTLSYHKVVCGDGQTANLQYNSIIPLCKKSRGYVGSLFPREMLERLGRQDDTEGEIRTDLWGEQEPRTS